MSFIGVVTDKKSESEIYNNLSKDFADKKMKNKVIMINEKNIDNVKNIKFETVLVNKKISKNMQTMEKILDNAKVLVVNSDIDTGLNKIDNLRITTITYGFNPKSTVTTSSVTDEEMLLCIQRSIKNINENTLEPQEIRIEKSVQNKNPYIIFGTQIVRILYN